MDASNLATWDSSNPWSMADFIVASGMVLTDDEARLVKRAHEDGHTWSVYRLHELTVLCFEARGWMRCASDGLRVASNHIAVRAQNIANAQGGHLVNGVVLCGDLVREIRALMPRIDTKEKP